MQLKVVFVMNCSLPMGQTPKVNLNPTLLAARKNLNVQPLQLSEHLLVRE